MLHMTHLIQRRFGARAPFILAMLCGIATIAIAVGLVVFQGR